MTENEVTVIKRRHDGAEVWRYTGKVLERTTDAIVLEAFFTRNDMPLGYVTLRHGDRMVEYFYADRWYNIFQIHDVDDNHVKGWYCNFTRPAHLADGVVAADDLELDLFVYPDGRILVLDEEEFDALSLSADESGQVRGALETLRRMVQEGRKPFRNFSE